MFLPCLIYEGFKFASGTKAQIVLALETTSLIILEIFGQSHQRAVQLASNVMCQQNFHMMNDNVVDDDYWMFMFFFFFRTVRAPVPWRNTYHLAKESCKKNLFITNPVMMKIQNLWYDR